MIPIERIYVPKRKRRNFGLRKEEGEKILKMNEK